MFKRSAIRDSLQRLLKFGIPLILLLSFSPLQSQETVQYGFSWTHEDIFISKAEGSDLTNIHLYGWGSLWPFPDGQAGEFDEGQIIDSRIQAAVDDGQEVMITIATAPSVFRLSGEPWNLEERVSPEHEDAFVERVKEFLEPRGDIRYVQIWNEFKGYWNAQLNRWDQEGYTLFYNKVYAAVKEVRPDILVGGGYMAARERGFGFDSTYNEVLVDKRDMSAMHYWMKNADGFDAICIDGDFAPSSYPQLTDYLRSLEVANNKPIWWSEFYNASGTMQEVAIAISSNLEPGDKSLWWAEERFLPFLNPSLLSSSVDGDKFGPLQVFPNPTETSITIKHDVGSAAFYRVITLDGRIIQEGLLRFDQKNVNLESHPPGLYLLQIGDSITKIVKE
ncbi:MAG: T9SS type A sorting domain-containing protein [Saprospiraceae bacterium]|nr:T9SS type A sorting domain-containing protein [Saprospiraceae bacterium]